MEERQIVPTAVACQSDACSGLFAGVRDVRKSSGTLAADVSGTG